MNLKITPNNLAKLEKIFEESKYIIRYEKGSFLSGYCLLEHKKVVVVNKFLTMEGRINTLLDILPNIQLDVDFMSAESQKLYKQVVDSKALSDAAAAAEQDEEDTPTTTPE
jgi:hypothetical protein